MFIVVLFTIAKICKQPKCPSGEEWIKQQWYIYTMKYYLAIWKKEILFSAIAWMDMEWNKPVIELQVPYDVTNMWNLMYNMN